MATDMKRRWLFLGVLLLAISFGGFRSQAAAPELFWHETRNTFDADISRIELSELLGRISSATGWEVYMEPGSSYSTSAKFKDLSRAEALRILLGNLNFEISPQSNAVPKLFVFKTGAGKATQLIHAEKRPLVLGKNNLILNHLIVTLKRGSGASIDAIAQQLGARVIGKLEGGNSYLLEFADEAAAKAAREQLSQIDSVAAVDSNFLLDRPSPFKTASVPAGGPSFALKAGTGGGDGKQIVIGLVDTAVQTLSADMQAFMLPSISIAGNANPGTDLPTHGTTMAESILFGLNSTAAKGQPTAVKILPVDVYGNDPNTTTFNVASGIVQAVNGGANILSLSLGSDGDSSFLRNLVDEVSQKGIPIFAAAGNQPVTTPVYPAAYPGVVAVTSAQDQSGTIAPYANRGDFVDIILPGATIVSFGNARFLVNGTSVSTALASGMMAGMADATKRAPAQLLSTFNSSVAFKR